MLARANLTQPQRPPQLSAWLRENGWTQNRTAELLCGTCRLLTAVTNLSLASGLATTRVVSPVRADPHSCCHPRERMFESLDAC